MNKEVVFPYRWNLKNAIFTKDQGKVFSCFACGGGSTMGYKLAGFDVIGCNEIDKAMIDTYKKNHNPQFAFHEGIQTFKLRDDLPDELYELDILDGSPPCSSFSMSGSREKAWGKEKKFREGQAEQVLDTLFFDFIDLAKKLQPKIIVAENVKGLLMGEAKSYVNKILMGFEDAGYYVDFQLLNAANMGIPQRRERVFFYAIRKDLYKGEFVDLFQTRPRLDLTFRDKQILYSEIKIDKHGAPMADSLREAWENRKESDRDFGTIYERMNGKPKRWNSKLIVDYEVPPTLAAGDESIPIRLHDPFKLHYEELISIGSFPTDYDFNNTKPNYYIGMSVPPVMTARIAQRINNQWLKKIKSDAKQN